MNDAIKLYLEKNPKSIFKNSIENYLQDDNNLLISSKKDFRNYLKSIDKELNKLKKWSNSGKDYQVSFPNIDFYLFALNQYYHSSL